MKESRIELIWAIWQFIKVVAISSIAGCVIIYIASHANLPSFVNYLVISLGTLIIISGIILAILKDIKSRIYRCEKCDNTFIPSIRSIFKGNKCPKCNSQLHYLKRDIKSC